MEGDWAREISTGEMSIDVTPDGVSLVGPDGSEPLDKISIERLYQALVTYRTHSNLEWEWARKGSDWWK